MARTILGAFFLTFLTFFLCICTTFAAENGTIHGHVRDAVSGDALPGATVLLVGTSLGGSTNLNGEFTIREVPPGTYSLHTTYIGYKPKQESVSVKPGGEIEVDLKLEPVGVQGKEVVVTAQASGQNQAINQQLSSDQIVSVVSAARIQELPDANAAESLGRLPGLSVLRTGGEADEVVIRGMAPRFNQIMVNGVELPSSDPNQRSLDLSMISSNMLEGMQVKKTVTPDMDASVIGGVVNLELREAHVVRPGVPVIGLLVQGGYNALSNAYNKLNNYKYVGSIEDRFFDEKFGVFVQADVERRNLTSNQLGAAYENDGRQIPLYLTDALNLDNVQRDRRRYDGAIVLDYKLPSGTIKLSNFLSTGITGSIDRGESFGVLGVGGGAPSNGLNTSLAYTNSTLSVIMNDLHFQYQLPVFQVDLRLSHAYTETKDPEDWTATFQQGNAAIQPLTGVAQLNPRDVPPNYNNDPTKSVLQNIANTSSFARGRALSASLDLSTNVNISDEITSVIKFGGMGRYQTRSYDYNTTGTQGLGILSSSALDDTLGQHFLGTTRYGNYIPMSLFVDPNYNFGKFLGGAYTMQYPLNFGMLSNWASYLRQNVGNIAKYDAIAYFYDQANSTMNDYTGHEVQSAGYVMATIHLGPQITLIPGVRYQNLQTTYTGSRGYQNTQSDLGAGPYQHYDTTITESHGFWLPDVAFQYRPLTWMDVRLSYTHTLAYPDYQAIIPKINVSSTEATISYNNYALVPSRSTNYDAYLSVYDNTIGLLTVGGFLKQIDNLIFQEQILITPQNIYKYYPPGFLLNATVPLTNPQVTTFINDPNQAVDYGLELDWETHFWYLPFPLNGLILDVNYTHVFSREEYPYVAIPLTGRSRIPFDTSYTTRLLYQPDNIANLSIGYDYKGFSIRVSMIYQDNIFSGPNYWPQLRTNTSAYTRWDLAAKQNLPWYGLQLYGDLNNLNSEDDIQVIQAPTGVPQSQQSYGMTADIGLRVRF